MKRNSHNSTISINQSTADVSHKDAVTSTDSNPALHGEATATTVSMYASFYWLINYIKMCNCRLANDVYTSFMSYWFPGRVLLPPHLLHLMQVHNRLRAERESHTVTYSRERPGALSIRNIVNTFKSYILSSEDEARICYAPKDLGYLANDREPMFVIVDSSCVSNPSSRELLIDNRFHTRDPILKRHFNKNVMPVDVPSTSRDLRNDFMAASPLLMESESTDEMQMVDINLQSDNEILMGSDFECDNDSIVISYLKNKDAFLDLEDWSEDSSSEDYFIPSTLDSSPSSSALSYHALAIERVTRPLPTVNYDGVKEATEFLHQDQVFLIAAEMADDNALRILINQGTNIHLRDHLGRNALHFAVHSEKRRVVERLLRAGVDPNVQDDLGMTPLTLCLMRSPNLLMATLLLDYGALLTPRISPVEPGVFLQFVMMCVPTRKEESILRLLVVSAGALVNDPDAPGGRQPLHFAAMSNNTRLINILVNLGADLFKVNHRNETPKQVAAIFRSKEAYALLESFEEMRKGIRATSTTATATTNEFDEMDLADSRRESQGSSLF